MRPNRLLDDNSYSERYQKIKEEHGRRIVKNWTEKTDPNKFVYEDCGIAAYLLELWCHYGIGPKKQFVDLGCGNGLLVYLLSKYFYRGFGIDARERKIWKEFREQGTQLKQAAIDPSSSEFATVHLANVDFLIGNHSDELTPWIPLIAARVRCNFFLLPCCPYDFFTKFSRKMPSAKAIAAGSPKGVVDQYNAYIENICHQLGFNVEIDYLKIPSRKRKCFIGTVPKEGLGTQEHIDAMISNLLAKAQLDKNVFVPKSPKEKVRNCTKLPPDYKTDLVKRILLFLINNTHEKKINDWRFGSCVPLSLLADQLLTDYDRQMLQMQDKGLQTFLRNNHQLFLVEKGTVAIRNWPTANVEFIQKAKNRERRSECCFYKWHPDGCPLSADICCFKH